jgi:hypothetical protein
VGSEDTMRVRLRFVCLTCPHLSQQEYLFVSFLEHPFLLIEVTRVEYRQERRGGTYE